MTFLCLDTGGDYTVLVLADELEGGNIRGVSIFEGRRTLSTRLFGQIDSLLKNNQLTLSELSGLAVGIGPGSFTGIRVGVTTAKTLAQVTGLPLVGIGTLDAYAQVWRHREPSLTVVPVLASRREEVYTGIYQNGQPIEPAFAATYTEMRARLDALQSQGNQVIVTGQPDLLGPLPHFTCLHQPWTPPEGLGILAAQRFAAHDFDDPIGLIPLYVVAPAISTPKDISMLPSSDKAGTV